MKKPILLAIILINSVFSMQAMLTLLRRARSAWSQGPNTPRNLTPSFSFYKKPLNDVAFQAKDSSLFSTGTQKRFYSSESKQSPISEQGSIPKQTGFWGWIASFFNQAPTYLDQQSTDALNKQILKQALSDELRAKGFDKIVTEVLYPENIKTTIARNNDKYRVRIFDENNLEKAKEKIGGILELSKDYKTLIVRKPITDATPEFRWRSPNASTLEYFYNKIGAAKPYVFEGTILDEVLCKIFSGYFKYFVSKEVIVNELLANYMYIKLAQWLIDQGVKINSDNEKNYVIGYEKFLISAYKELYELKSSPEQETFSSENVNSFKKIFADLDPIMEKLISNPELKKEFHRMQQERREIDYDPQGYRKIMEEKGRRRQYIKEKAEKLEREYKAQTGLYRDFSDFLSEVQFDELEYEEWKKTGYLKGEKERIEQMKRKWQQQWEQGGREKARQQYEEWRRGQGYKPESDDRGDYDEKKIKELRERFGLPYNASAEMILDSVRNYIKQEHPDKLKNKDMSVEEKTKKAKEYGEFIGYYDDTIAELKKRKKQEKR